MPISHVTAVMLGAAIGGSFPIWILLACAVFETFYYAFSMWWETYLDRDQPPTSEQHTDAVGFVVPDSE